MIGDSNQLLGRTLGTCTLQRLIGRGGMGAVYLAQQSRPRRTVAVKVLMPDSFLERKPRAAFLARFRREADAIAALDHVNIMPLYAYGEQDELAYLVMPYVTGGTLRDRLDKRPTLSLDEVVPIIEQAAAALDAAHAQGIIHRDLKPGNILFHADGRVLLADFGLAKMLNDVQEDERESEGGSPLTSTGTIIGTPEYLSPEQGTGKLVDYHTDVYSLGIVLFRMLAGRVPFIGSSPVAVAIQHAMEAPPSLSRFNSAVPPDVEAVVMKALAKQPEERFSSAGELARTLRDTVLASSSTQPLGSWPKAVVVPPTPMLLTSHDVQPDNDTQPDIQEGGLHDAPTEASPPVLPPRPQKPGLVPVQLQNADTSVETPEALLGPKKEQKISGPKKEQEIAAPRVQFYENTRPRVKQRSGGFQSLGMMLLGSILTLLVVVGGFAWYVHFLPGSNQTQNKSTKPAVSATPASKTPAALPSPAVPAGALLYGTSLPGSSCDTQSGKWSNTASAKVTCSKTATELTSTGTNHLAATSLDALPGGKQLPGNYIIQVQATINPGSRGVFGIFFLNQPGPPLKTYMFLLDPAGSWKAGFYDDSTGQTNAFANGPIQGKMDGTITIDVVVQGNSATFYMNGTHQGGATDLGASGGTFGLAVDAGTDVSFKNLAIYASP